jgi:hypothetical protein
MNIKPKHSGKSKLYAGKSVFEVRVRNGLNQSDSLSEPSL